MSWLPGITTSGSPNPRRRRAARSCWSRRPRWVRSPLATTISGTVRSISVVSARSISGSSRVPVCRSERWRIRVGTRSSRLYTPAVTEDSAEIFDDLYLGVRAGGALRKQRRGEPLTSEEREALGRWQRLSTWRKALAIGSFGIGTFGLGFTLGGLVFGRWRPRRSG